MSSNASSDTTIQARAIRAFNRFYTQRIGVLDRYLGSELSLTDVRVLYELAQRDQPAASELAQDLALDTGYLSRILRRFESSGWLERAPSPADRRQSLLRLTAAGQAAYAPLQQQSDSEALALLDALPVPQRNRLVEAMATVQQLLQPAAGSGPRTLVLRDPRAGDIGWVVQQHGEIYSREYGWNLEFEGLVSGVASDFVKNFQPAWERCWIADVDGERAGSVFVVRKSATVAQLRMLILAPAARGHGLGSRLVDESIAFARGKGYRKLVLWTNSNLLAARAIYARRGFLLKTSEAYTGYGGHKLVGETWELKL